MEDLEGKVGSLNLGGEEKDEAAQREANDSDDSFHSAASDDDEDGGFMDTESSITESSERVSRGGGGGTGDDDTEDEEGEWLPANQHTPKVTTSARRRRRLKTRLGLGEDGSGENLNTMQDNEKETMENSWNCSKEREEEKQEEQQEEQEEDFVDEEKLKDLELTMTEEEKDVQREESLKCKTEGNTNFKSGKYIEAVWDYTSGLRTCPLAFTHDRAILYANRAAAKAKLDRKKEAIRDCSRAVELDGAYTKAVLRRATLQEEVEELDEALRDFQRVLELDPSCREAQAAVTRLPNMINERNEKLKQEAMSKLKDLGNMILRPFGLSTSNFELKQDETSGGYNISFKQNPNS